MSAMIQVHAYFSGMVQGVGFRYTVQRYATDLGLAGWVRNLPDGRVEMKAVGPRDALEDLVRRVDAHFDGYVSDTQVWWEDHPEQFTDFKITF